MIVYYSGHGMHRDDLKQLDFTPTLGSYVHHSRRWIYEARINWNKSEELLRSDEVEEDVLTILDTVYASNIVGKGQARSDEIRTHVQSDGTRIHAQSEDTRIFELLSACALDTTTAAPGPFSFTRALIDGLKELSDAYRDSSFTTFHLTQLINLNPARRDTPSMLWNILQNQERHIRLAPLARGTVGTLESKTTQGQLMLRLRLRDDTLQREQIEFLSRALTKALANKNVLGLRGIDWIGLRRTGTDGFIKTALVVLAAVRCKSAVGKKRHARTLKRKMSEEESLGSFRELPWDDVQRTTGARN